MNVVIQSLFSLSWPLSTGTQWEESFGGGQTKTTVWPQFVLGFFFFFYKKLCWKNLCRNSRRFVIKTSAAPTLFISGVFKGGDNLAAGSYLGPPPLNLRDNLLISSVSDKPGFSVYSLTHSLKSFGSIRVECRINWRWFPATAATPTRVRLVCPHVRREWAWQAAWLTSQSPAGAGLPSFLTSTHDLVTSQYLPFSSTHLEQGHFFPKSWTENMTLVQIPTTVGAWE